LLHAGQQLFQADLLMVAVAMVYWKDESTDDQFVRLFVFDRIQFESIKLKCLLAVIDEIGLVD
jgi:hypothetical protein